MATADAVTEITLPAHLEAAEPPEARGLERDGVRLLISRVDAGTIHHARFNDLPRWLSSGDLLVGEQRKLLRIDLTDAVEAEEMFTKLMGDEVEPRRQFIEDNALNVRNLDV